METARAPETPVNLRTTRRDNQENSHLQKFLFMNVYVRLSLRLKIAPKELKENVILKRGNTRK
jgi:hypothetical protein